MKIYFRNKKGFTRTPKFGVTPKGGGFTLIELLVVVAIIGLLSSIVMASLNSARNKAKDSAIKESAYQLSSLMALNYNDYGDYCYLQYGWITSVADCNSAFSNSSTYKQNAQNICVNLVNNASDSGGIYKIYSNTAAGCATAYTFMIYLNDGKWFCTGSSGRKGEYASYSGSPGCWDNP